MPKNNDYKVLEKLTRIIGPSSFEKEVQEYFSELMRSLGCETYKDNIKNYYAEIEGDSKLPRVMINAHADSVGFMINHIDDKGFIFTKDIGPWDNAVDYRFLPATDVVIYGRKSGKKVYGHFNTIHPIHELSKDELKESIDRDELPIDIGARSPEQAKRYVDIGDYAAFDTNCSHWGLNSNNQFKGTNLDDRTGLFCMYRIARDIMRSRMKKKCPITFVSTVSEEAFTGAAGVAAKNVNPDLALTIDGTVATDQIRDNNSDTVAKRNGIIELDKGPVLPRGPGVNDDLFQYLEKICKGRSKTGAKIPNQVEVGSKGTENEHIQIAGKGTKTAAILIPLRNLHTRVETASLKDVEYTITLCTEFYKKVSRGRFR